MSFYAGFGIGIFVLATMFIIYVVLSSLYALLAIIIGKILKVEMNYASGMRLSSIAYIVTSFLMGLLRFFGLGTPWVIYAVAIAILQVIVIKAIASKQ